MPGGEKVTPDSMVTGSVHGEVVFLLSPKGRQEAGRAEVGTHPSEWTGVCAKAPEKEELLALKELETRMRVERDTIPLGSMAGG